MGNLSQEKRERMLAFLNKVKEEHKDDDEMLIALDEIENELNSKKYGLVWEKHEEEVDRMMQDNIPVFTEVKEREIKATDENAYNFLLEGDNLHSLKLLEKTHAGKIDVIYIDPPYNTGSKDFTYNDVLVDENDGYRHSKWLSFMSERLQYAKKLLTDSGMIMISINDIELYSLKLLCDSIYGESNLLANMIWQSTPGSNTGLDIKTVTEYVLCYAKNKMECTTASRPIEDDQKYKFRDNYVEKRGKYLLNKLDRRMTGQHYSESLNYAIKTPDGRLVFPGGEEEKQKHWNWRWSESKVAWGVKNNFIEFKQSKNGKWAIYFKQYFKVNNNDEVIERSLPYQNLIKDLNGANSARGTQEIMSIFDKKAFDYPKPLNLIKYLLRIHANQNATVLDFFAGSGTTAQAVLELNKEDGGNRKFILCTNNENNICEEVTYERIKRVIHGYADVEGIPANLKYFKTDFIPKDADDVSEELLSHIKEMVELENGITLDNKHYLIVLTDEQADELAKNWSNYEDVKAIYVSHNVLFTSEQNALFSNTDIHIIPDYYFEYELKEVGEAW
ncbi:site-specific DNA-methyltransferase [Gardnerella leopoldii]|uniref:site-specific DNA-methyltransferase n=1 Tax=Gardnerella leopoldii TaxID=2792978 RepID=UPI000DD8A85B|nr:site-specific DNA-methyltransferase [Gardnerella leopoldii]